MKTDFFFLSPVQAVKVTPQNLEEVAEWCGGRVAETDSRRVAGRKDKYVWVPTPKGSAISWAFPGMFVTRRVVMTVDGKFKETWAVFRRDYFEKNYFETVNAAVDETWEKFLKHNHEPADLIISKEDNLVGQHKLAEEPRPVTVNIFQNGTLKDSLEAATAVIKEAFPDAEIIEDIPVKESELGYTDALMKTPQEI